MPVVVCGCETWSLTLNEGHGLRVLGILVTNKDKVRGEWRIRRNWELHGLYSSPHIIWVNKSNRMGLIGHVAGMRHRRGVCRTLVGKLKGKRPLGKHRRRWEDNIKMDIQEIKLDFCGLGKDTDGGLLCRR